MNPQPPWPARLTGSIAAEVRKHRKAQGMSAQQLAGECAKLGVDLPRNTLTDLENGRRASLSVAELFVLARALDVPPLLLVFPVGGTETAEVLPGQVAPTWRAFEWASGEGPFPGPDDAGLLTLLDPWNSGGAASLALYRMHDRAAEEELRAGVRARDMDKMAAAAASEEERQAYAMAAEATWRRAETVVRSGERLRAEAAARGWRPPDLIMRLLIPRAPGGEPGQS